MRYGWISSWIALSVALLLGSAQCACADDAAATLFTQLDADKNGQLSADEYIQRAGPREKHFRDLNLFDFNRDQQLSPSEFSAIPGLGPVHLRGALPDPFEAMLDVAVAAMDESYNNWDQRPDEVIYSRSFTQTFAESLAGGGRQNFSVAEGLVDTTGDGRVSRAGSTAVSGNAVGTALPSR